MDIITQQTLAWVNRVRADYDLGAPLDDLPSGARSVAEACPIAAALNYAAGVCQNSVCMYEGTDNSVMLDTTVSVAQWIKDFDGEMYPEYDVNAGVEVADEPELVAA